MQDENKAWYSVLYCSYMILELSLLTRPLIPSSLRVQYGFKDRLLPLFDFVNQFFVCLNLVLSSPLAPHLSPNDSSPSPNRDSTSCPLNSKQRHAWVRTTDSISRCNCQIQDTLTYHLHTESQTPANCWDSRHGRWTRQTGAYGSFFIPVKRR